MALRKLPFVVIAALVTLGSELPISALPHYELKLVHVTVVHGQSRPWVNSFMLRLQLAFQTSLQCETRRLAQPFGFKVALRKSIVTRTFRGR